MSAFNQYEDLLRRTFVDQSLTKEEAATLRRLVVASANPDETRRFIRNRAFDFGREGLSRPMTVALLNWLEDVVKAVDVEHAAVTPIQSAAYFSPGDACREAIIAQIEESRRSIDICVFTITDNRISDALQAAQRRQVQLRIITDDEKARDPGSDIGVLKRAGMPIATDAGPDHMHHKFALFDHTVLVSGSFNWTRSASNANFENVTVTTDSALITAFSGEFERLWKTLGKI